jgi:hypothetical protein
MSPEDVKAAKILAELFTKTDSGQWFYEWLREIERMPVFVQGQPDTTLINEGQRQLASKIIALADAAKNGEIAMMPQEAQPEEE